MKTTIPQTPETQTSTAPSGQSGHRRGKKRHRRRIPVWGRVLLGIAGALVVLAGAAVLYINGKLDLIQYHDGSVDSVGSIDADEDQDLDTTGLTENTGEMVMPEGSPFEDSDVLNVLLISTDERTDAVNDADAFTHLNELDGTSDTTEFSDNARADSLILVSLNIREDTIKLVSIERATGVPILLDGYEGQYDWITHTFRYGGAKLTMETVEDCFNVAVDHYVRINFNSFVQIVDAVGGVDIDLTEEEAAALNWEVPSNSMLIVNKVTPGVNHMDGYTALQYARLRAIDNDWMRIQRQRTVIQAVLDQIRSATPLELNSLLDTVLPLVQTNFTKSEITALLVQLPGFLGVQADQMSLPVQGTYGVRTGMDDRQMYDPDWAENIAVLHDFLYGEDSDSDYYPHGETIETALDDYSQEELEEFGSYLADNTLPVSLSDTTGLWPTEQEFAALSQEQDPTPAPEEDVQPEEAGQDETEPDETEQDQPRVYLLGDTFTANDGNAVRQAMVSSLYQRGMRWLLTEDGLAEGILINRYITGGEESLLDRYAAAHPDLPAATLDFYRWLRQFNSGLTGSDRIQLYGIGPDTASRSMTGAALSLLWDSSAAAEEPVADIAYWLQRCATEPTTTAADYLMLRLNQQLEDTPELVQTLFGDNLPLVEQLLDNADRDQQFREQEGTAAEKSQAMYDNFTLLCDLLPQDSVFFADVSLQSASATAITERGEDSYRTFGRMLNGSDSPVEDRVASAAVLYLPADGDITRALPNDRTFDYTLLQGCRSDLLEADCWIRLDGEDSPFLEDVPLFNPGEEEVSAAADYFPALLTIRSQS